MDQSHLVRKLLDQGWIVSQTDSQLQAYMDVVVPPAGPVIQASTQTGVLTGQPSVTIAVR